MVRKITYGSHCLRVHRVIFQTLDGAQGHVSPDAVGNAGTLGIMFFDRGGHMECIYHKEEFTWRVRIFCGIQAVDLAQYLHDLSKETIYLTSDHISWTQTVIFQILQQPAPSTPCPSQVGGWSQKIRNPKRWHEYVSRESITLL